MGSASAARKRLRKLLWERKYLVAPCGYDALSAKAIQAAGFDIMGTTGYGMHGVILGTPDTGLLAINEEVTMLKNMCAAVDIPILADAEGGYGNALNVIRTIREYENAGVAGLFIEDQKQPPNCPFIKKAEVISKEEMIGKIHAAVDTRTDEDMLIIARTDAPFEEGVERCNAYLEAGADMVKILPKSKEELLKAPKLINGPIHLGLYVNKGINDGMTAKDCGELGYKIMTYPVSSLFAQTYALQHYFKYLKENETDEGYDGNMISFDEYLKFIGVDEIKAMGEKYGLND
ncbi:MAG: isocitrate lyase/PEP mutase family protein [Bacillota bacterium]|uniref:2-Methylisocitrate lyase, PEP mutase family n=1 Tax=[Clostridium] aminophilum TaxID=1526 RepID=A0A1I0GYF8_9FIRM|nr:isocitrate lyase/PEP mutase family protein [[Clostridium] aminophilum]MCR4629225.1 isocitrate lyase/PEP mutase family protein [Clostridium sp.]MDT3845099.1 isocitrate lyase/PEP mutase family protein [Bacillota bacterium]SET76282.1 2-Methylisocitrate lyase, PEP mutase family [[Clostridium] aminophilum]SFR83636.1 2-Methylisocitrate lyase, PEP mutase family [[Clostridium] aminophilum]